MIKNTHYSYDYSQPEDYRFSLDSVFLAQKVALKLGSHPEPETLKVLDLCSGCGVVGLELNFHLRALKKIDFLEVQDVYLPHFEENVVQAKTEDSHFRFLNMNYADLLNEEFKEHYDVIISNPPYFFLGEGLLSPNEFKNRCRFFIDSDFNNLIKAVLFSLRPGGRAYLLVRPGSHHGRNLFDEIKDLSLGFADVQILDEVRGTNIVELVKNPLEVSV
ncbi:SAM-dependent methyltransferase [Bacteriovorax stolpii]|uniref:SAM-dependent methyltransferase n=1 Tax=Bacteriovorax stolpii TaxID=960 RepID=A0A2K9NPZ0_BACTC|nr:methyltransferase [Bacteriovorax stolpii]AUN97579.1 SAM-dependent methyltransferase [Bacteriovorax stolpii]QDK42448.1 SAM-dependent methyltransferase [Bacteriovorax stolpii]TDP52760.1 methyltransferase family protein [Bacteriovorax stolpii]